MLRLIRRQLALGRERDGGPPVDRHSAELRAVERIRARDLRQHPGEPLVLRRPSLGLGPGLARVRVKGVGHDAMMGWSCVRRARIIYRTPYEGEYVPGRPGRRQS